MPLTDEQIRALRDLMQNHSAWWSVTNRAAVVAELCTRVLASEARVKALENEGAQLAANQCHDGYGDEWGNHRCRVQDALQARVKVLEDALRWYGEQTRLAKLIHSEGDSGRNALAKDGGQPRPHRRKTAIDIM